MDHACESHFLQLNLFISKCDIDSIVVCGIERIITYLWGEDVKDCRTSPPGSQEMEFCSILYSK